MANINQLFSITCDSVIPNPVWGEKQKNGIPENICNPNNGNIDSLVARHWKKFDISLILRTNWNFLRPDLENKIRISVGNADNFSLDKAVKLLESEMKNVHAGMEFAYYPGDHFTVWTHPDYENDGKHFLAQKYVDWLTQHQTQK